MKALYLDPQLHVIASAGWAISLSASNQRQLSWRWGCGEMPLAAVRGEQSAADLGDARRGRDSTSTIHENRRFLGGIERRRRRQPTCSWGQEPLALALAEHARVIVAGAFGRVGSADDRTHGTLRPSTGLSTICSPPPRRRGGRRLGSIGKRSAPQEQEKSRGDPERAEINEAGPSLGGTVLERKTPHMLVCNSGCADAGNRSRMPTVMPMCESVVEPSSAAWRGPGQLVIG